jgi:hypothetical protein
MKEGLFVYPNFCAGWDDPLRNFAMVSNGGVGSIVNDLVWDKFPDYEIVWSMVLSNPKYIEVVKK